MIVASVCIILIALLLLLHGLRGRVALRGVFCGACRFDLAGIDLDSAQARCPECGAEVHNASARRSMVRRASRVWIVAGLLFAAIGFGGLYAALFVANATLCAYLPSPIVLSLAERGHSDAIDEALRRWSTPDELTEDQQGRLIQTALDIQADRERAWDPRWGELLRNAIEMQQLSDEQLISFVTNGYTYRVALPNQMRQGENEIAYTMKLEGDRVMSTWGGVMPYQHWAWVTAWGVVEQEPIGEFGSPRYMRPMVLQGPEPSDDSVRSRFRGATAFSEAPIGTEVEIFVEYQIRLQSPDREEPILDRTIRQTQTLSIVDDKTPIVKRKRGEQLSAQVLDAVRLTPLYTTEQPITGEVGHQVFLANTTLLANELPAPLAMRVSLVIGDVEFEVERFSMRTQPGTGFAEVISWRIMPPDEQKIAEAIPLHQRLIEAGRVDVIMRPHPEHAREDPEITEIADVSLIFRNIPVRLMTTPDWMHQTHLDQATIKGEVLDREDQEPEAGGAP